MNRILVIYKSPSVLDEKDKNIIIINSNNTITQNRYDLISHAAYYNT